MLWTKVNKTSSVVANTITQKSPKRFRTNIRIPADTALNTASTTGYFPDKALVAAKMRMKAAAATQLLAKQKAKQDKQKEKSEDKAEVDRDNPQ